MTNRLSHLDATGKAQMVDVSHKQETDRKAVAKGEIKMRSVTLEMITEGKVKKGDVLTVAQVAGVLAAKKTAELIPLCHPLPLTYIDVLLEPDQNLPGIKITAEVRTKSNTGVEMEALTAVSVAALTVYDMSKAIDKKMRIQNIRLVEKHGGLSGDIQNE